MERVPGRTRRVLHGACLPVDVLEIDVSLHDDVEEHQQVHALHSKKLANRARFYPHRARLHLGDHFLLAAVEDADVPVVVLVVVQCVEVSELLQQFQVVRLDAVEVALEDERLDALVRHKPVIRRLRFPGARVAA